MTPRGEILFMLARLGCMWRWIWACRNSRYGSESEAGHGWAIGCGRGYCDAKSRATPARNRAPRDSRKQCRELRSRMKVGMEIGGEEPSCRHWAITGCSAQCGASSSTTSGLCSRLRVSIAAAKRTGWRMFDHQYALSKRSMQLPVTEDTKGAAISKLGSSRRSTQCNTRPTAP